MTRSLLSQTWGISTPAVTVVLPSFQSTLEIYRTFRVAISLNKIMVLIVGRYAVFSAEEGFFSYHSDNVHDLRMKYVSR